VSQADATGGAAARLGLGLGLGLGLTDGITAGAALAVAADKAAALAPGPFAVLCPPAAFLAGVTLPQPLTAITATTPSNEVATLKRDLVICEEAHQVLG
jgi:hypothetical protein